MYNVVSILNTQTTLVRIVKHPQLSKSRIINCALKALWVIGYFNKFSILGKGGAW